MKDILIKILSILDKKQKKRLFFFSFFLLFITFLELTSIGTLYQLSKVLLDPDNLNKLIATEPLYYLSQNIGLKINLNFLVYFLLFIFAFKFFFNIIYYYLQSKFVEDVRKKLTSKLTKLYLIKEYKFFLSRGSSILIRNITSEVGSFSLGIVNNLLILITELFIFLSIIYILLINDYKLVITILLTITLIGLSYFYFTRSISQKLSIQKLKHSNLFLKSVIYLFKSIKNIKIYNSEKFHKININKHLSKISEAQIFFSITSQLPRMIMETSIVFLMGLFLLTKELEFINSDLMSKIALFVISSFRIIPSISKIMACINQIRFNIPSINVLYKDSKGLSFPNSKNNIINFKNKIEARNISFKYPSQKKYLFKDLNFKFHAGKLIGIVGESGSGKSTLFDLVIKLHTPVRGNILMDNNKILNWQNIIHNFSYATQETSIFNDTLKNNIINGNEKLLYSDQISDKKIEYILTKCGLKNFYKSLPRGVNSIISEDGKNISVGQRQRIGIARCLLKDSHIWLLDEITSSLDKANEKLILRNIKNISKKSLKIFITHNTSNLDLCDEVYKVANKKLIRI